jgi:molybdopterin-guanine dinucleotide biosynthesis protein A
MTHDPRLINGAILAGGAASRFGGRPKGLEVVGGERVVDRLAGVMREALGQAPVLIANDPGAARWDTGLRIEGDVLPGYGALGGSTPPWRGPPRRWSRSRGTCRSSTRRW